MTKDIKGLLIYTLIIIIIWLMPLGMLYCGFGALYVSYYGNESLANKCILLAVVLFFLYFILPIVFTYRAMKHHWSKYLDKFFYHKWWPTIIFLFFIILHACSNLYEGSIYTPNIFKKIAIIISTFIAPSYYLPYIILLIMKKCKLL